MRHILAKGDTGAWRRSMNMNSIMSQPRELTCAEIDQVSGGGSTTYVTDPDGRVWAENFDDSGAFQSTSLVYTPPSDSFWGSSNVDITVRCCSLDLGIGSIEVDLFNYTGSLMPATDPMDTKLGIGPGS